MWRGLLSFLVLGALVLQLLGQLNLARAQPQDSVITPPLLAPKKYSCSTSDTSSASTQSPTWSCQACDCGVGGWQSCPSTTDASGNPAFTVVQGIHSSTDAWGKETCYAYCYGLSPNCSWQDAP
jgi:hypothetical protein